MSDTWVATYETHGSAVMAFLASRTGRRDVAEDLLQETFVRAIRARPTPPDASGIRSYLLTTAQHLLIDRQRQRRVMLFSEAPERALKALEEVADARTGSPEAAADLGRVEQRLGAALATLAPAQRTAFREAVLEEKPYSTIAVEQGWTLAQVKTNVHRARRKVVATLGELLLPRE